MIDINTLKNSKGSGLYKRAKALIPGGTQLLSKRPEMFAPEVWPAYYSKAKGCRVWDLDGREYIDMSIMAVGACILGYADGKHNIFDIAKKIKKNIKLVVSEVTILEKHGLITSFDTVQ